jgi:hypothetical protein
MLLDFRILPFQSNLGYEVILSIDTLSNLRICVDISNQTIMFGIRRHFLSRR